MKEKDIIDAEYHVIEENKNENVNVNVDPQAAIISGMFDIVKEGMRCHTQYKMLKEEQKTERARIKAEYKLLQERICARHEELMTMIQNSHQEKMEQIHHNHTMENKIVDHFQMLINKAAADGRYEDVNGLLSFQMNYISYFQNNNANLISQNEINPEKLLGWSPDDTKLLTDRN